MNAWDREKSSVGLLSFPFLFFAVSRDGVETVTYQLRILVAERAADGSCRFTVQTHSDGLRCRGSGCGLLGVDEVGMVLLRDWGV